MIKDLDTIDKRLEKLAQSVKANRNKPQELAEAQSEAEVLEKRAKLAKLKENKSEKGEA